jgi:aryl-alcohol dehydrogenase-like predicted oxidoreductase
MARLNAGVLEQLPAGVNILGSAVNPLAPEAQLPINLPLEREVIAYQPFGSGAVFDGRVPGESGTARARAAMRYALQQPGVRRVVFGASTRAHLVENVAGL